MYGKFFASTYTGSMVGAGTDVFAVWGYVIANTQEGQVELNPKFLSAILGTTEEKVLQAIEYLSSPDPNSRTKLEDGKRLIREGQFAYRVPTFFSYRAIRNEEERREYNRIKKAEERDRKKSKIESLTVNECQHTQRQYTESNTTPPVVPPSPRVGRVNGHDSKITVRDRRKLTDFVSASMNDNPTIDFKTAVETACAKLLLHRDEAFQICREAGLEP